MHTKGAMGDRRMQAIIMVQQEIVFEQYWENARLQIYKPILRWHINEGGVIMINYRYSNYSNHVAVMSRDLVLYYYGNVVSPLDLPINSKYLLFMNHVTMRVEKDNTATMDFDASLGHPVDIRDAFALIKSLYLAFSFRLFKGN
jgi:hypothetical protein